MKLEALIAKAEKQGISALTSAELRFCQVQELRSGLTGELPFKIAHRRERALESPSFFITDVVDEFYKVNFEPAHYKLCDEVIGPYLLGESVTLDGQSYDPKDYIGMLILMSRDTFKSSIAGLMVTTEALVPDIPEEEKAPAMPGGGMPPGGMGGGMY